MKEPDPPIIYRQGYGRVPVREDVSDKEKQWKAFAFVLGFTQGRNPNDQTSMHEIMNAYAKFLREQDANA